jgi:dienelactone hydrolase
VTVFSSSGFGQVTAGQGNLLLVPKVWNRDGTVPGVIYCHGATQTEHQLLDNANYPNLSSILFAIADAGFPVLACGFGGDSFGNATARTQVGTARTYLQATVGAKAGPVALVGGSMGGGLAMTYALANPSHVSCLVLLQTVVSLQDVVTRNVSGLAAAVNAAYGGSYSDVTHGPTASPILFADQMTKPAQFWYATDDATIVPAALSTSLASAYGDVGGGVVDVRTMTGGHTDAAHAQVDKAAVVTFLQANA